MCILNDNEHEYKYEYRVINEKFSAELKYRPEIATLSLRYHDWVSMKFKQIILETIPHITGEKRKISANNVGELKVSENMIYIMEDTFDNFDDVLSYFRKVMKNFNQVFDFSLESLPEKD